MTQPKKPRQKNIKLTDIQKQYKKVNTYKTHILNEKENKVIRYYEVFDETRIQELIKEAYEDVVYAEENGLNTFKDVGDVSGDMKFIKYIYFLIIKHMTELKNEIVGNLEEKSRLFNQIEAIGLFHELMENVFLPEEVSKVLERVGNFALLANQMTEKEKEERQKALESVQHPLMKKKLEEGMNNA
ncbi:hypothetical protein [Bacillus sp. FJAT-22090]|uniref:hypothetical protein n=1 Tax=Bacillus sp. FJAT-22090 TaxID=1581038 RepID=UPI0011AA9C92|nr:hypothetical protein [Bacillus sp. FJAT-22090]